jgi:hypothetical protein
VSGVYPFTPVSADRRSKSSTIRPKPSRRNQWKVSSMISGDRFTQCSSMSMAANAFRNGASSGVLRRAWSPITSSVAYRASSDAQRQERCR